ncbi:hypothetical protein HPDFL43_02170 [Hoeflea phototrophica DFL-43]|uniref:YdhG-like domain-containing protein n=1 Tax=Hoeflea phototrophica (strain DSM 17068 / NCIMB 14078 / DFL-43) TaxID=411684 RepID=A9D0B1_HOEPD|nr:DUF1801 domain-containing protein [Hoeflea phototrophica]EDQ34965.1 hypothetical protein HPDFL43_02170 [Hoeflea phototrophica DFL-43]
MSPEDLKTLILSVAERTPEIGPLEESLKWGEQSFTPAKRNVGSSVRIAPRDNGDVALMFICHTNLVEEFRGLYPDGLVFEGNRAIVLSEGFETDQAGLEHCIALALTYKLRKRQRPA